MAKKSSSSTEKSGETMNVRFTKSPTGAFGLAYSEGDEAELDSETASQVIAAGFATEVK